MVRSRPTSRVAFPVVIGLTLVMAMLPWSWRRPWAEPIGAIVRIPLTPVGDLLHAIGGRLRPAPSPVGAIEASVEDLELEVERLWQLYRAEQKRTRNLAEQVAQLQQLPPEVLRSSSMALMARVVMDGSDSTLGASIVRLPRTLEQPLVPGTVAVYQGVHLLGRTTDASDRRHLATVMPAAHPSVGALQGRVFPDPDGDSSRSFPVYLEPTGTGSFISEIDRSASIERGARVRLDDDSWPATAQMMIIGEVSSVKVDDDEPLRDRLVVTPIYELRDVSTVTLLVAAVPAHGDGDEGP